MASIWDWSKTAGSNASSDANINWAEGQSPATVNDSARQMMGRIAEWRDDINGSVTLTGANTITATMNSAFTTYTTGLMVTAQIAAANTSTTVTLNLNSIAAKNVVKVTSEGEESLAVGDLKANSFVTFIYDEDADGATGAWVLPVPATANDAEMQRFNRQGADIASATTTDISAPTGDYISITGTTTITALGTAPVGVNRTLVFAGALTLTHNATSLILPTAANITTAAGDRADFLSLGSGNWICTRYYDANDKDYIAKIRLPAGSDVDLSSTAHPFQIGVDSSTNIAMDSNEIQARNNGAAANLSIQQAGGAADFGGIVQFGDDLKSADGSGFFYDYSVGRLGLGTGAPDYSFHIKSSSPIIKLEDTTNSAYHLVYGADEDMYISCDHGNGALGSQLIFRVDGSTVASFTTTNVMNINTTTINVPADSIIDNGVGEYIQFNNSSNYLQFWVTGTERLRINNDGTLNCVSGGGSIVNYGGVYASTTTQTANVYVNGTGDLKRSTSSGKYKKDVSDVDVQDAIIVPNEFRPRRYRALDAPDDSEKAFGFIAEEIYKVNPQFASYNDILEEVDGVEWNSITSLLVSVVKDQQKRISALEARVDFLAML